MHVFENVIITSFSKPIISLIYHFYHYSFRFSLFLGTEITVNHKNSRDTLEKDRFLKFLDQLENNIQSKQFLSNANS